MNTKHNYTTCDGATVYGHTTPTRPTPSYLRDYHNDNRPGGREATRCARRPLRGAEDTTE